MEGGVYIVAAQQSALFAFKELVLTSLSTWRTAMTGKAWLACWPTTPFCFVILLMNTESPCFCQ